MAFGQKKSNQPIARSVVENSKANYFSNLCLLRFGSYLNPRISHDQNFSKIRLDKSFKFEPNITKLTTRTGITDIFLISLNRLKSMQMAQTMVVKLFFLSLEKKELTRCGGFIRFSNISAEIFSYQIAHLFSKTATKK